MTAGLPAPDSPELQSLLTRKAHLALYRLLYENIGNPLSMREMLPRLGRASTASFGPGSCSPAGMPCAAGTLSTTTS